ncbi:MULTISPECIES: D-TA family PLP-dependent enzyme [Sinorhizobium]|uniref:Alanine racemase n=1 Tax=Sinorhizobium americanum TaxID=194963 RepID=A0A2S3YRP1_9HYPH|nr:MULTISPECIES: D-TA family PLP-dependent enzyme [Sinorhizobium]ASY60109.1 low-specificity D-threonine aldolase [Sinorhizobium sp. CCBAU 05631]PDT43323.1 alanine racemase [Sinorhizobium sp. FG01]PDT52868.1 alanine racemase [Sinorhizobium sp. NG07B]POH29039.1 alanine racemase [Sinorhizobium americanum]POH34326.1 alanine racemase [Sinorhizobium americanum]
MQLPIETPAVLVDLDIARRNIYAFQAYADRHGIRVRPHIKTHKLPQMAELQLEAGAIGITCQKVSEAEAMVDGSPRIKDVLITYNILGEAKLARLVRLNERVALSVVADNPAVVDGMSAVFADATKPLTVLVECNTGADRCGVASPEAAAELARRVAEAPGLRFGGLMTYPPAGGEARVQAFMSEAKRLIEAEGLEVPTITSGGTPSMMQAAEAPIATEYRPGTYIYNDRSLVARGVATWQDCALTVLATVVSVPAENRAIIDAGSKVLTSDLLGLAGYGHVLGHDDIRIDQLSEEHGRLVCDGPIRLKVGEQVRVVPNHACVVTNMVDAVHILEAGQPKAEWSVVARGRVL